MNEQSFSHLREDARKIYTSAIASVMPGPNVIGIMKDLSLIPEKTTVISVGKAAWTMAEAALECLDAPVKKGLVLTKYEHGKGALDGLEIMEAGHPLVDENSFAGTKRAIEMVQDLGEDDTVLFLLSGGGSALFELSDLPLDELRDISEQLLSCGADIREINTIRKRLSLVKGGRFAQIASPAKVIGIVLSDVLGDRIDMIASGPISPDLSTCEDALRIVEKYHLHFSDQAMQCLSTETPKSLNNVECHICGSVRRLCRETKKVCESLGYEATVLTDSLSCAAREAGYFLSKIATTHAKDGIKRAFIAGGETVVYLSGEGIGGRNQELALAASVAIDGLQNVAVFSVGSDGTDGPTDAAGGYVDGSTASKLLEKNIQIDDVLKNNDSYHALDLVNGLIKTGPTGTNVNDVAVVLIDSPAVVHSS